MATDLTINGMTCQKCVAHVTAALQGVPGVAQATVMLDNERASVHGDADPAALIAAVREAGYEAAVV